MENVLKNKKAMTLPIIAILIIGLVALVILILILVPGLKDGVEDLLKILGLNNKDSYIRSFEVEQGLEGSIVFRYRFINDDNILGYELNATSGTGEKKLGVIETTETEHIFGEEFEEDERKDYLLNGKQIEHTELSPAGLEKKVYTLYAIDNNHRVLEKKEVEWPGMFEEQDKYLTEIMGFMAFAEGLKGLEEDKTANMPYQEDLIMLGFSKDFNNGWGGYLNQGGWFRAWCGKDEIKAPPECEEQNSCLCLCKRDNNGKKLDKEEFCHVGGRICFGYVDYGFIGGTRRSCGMGDGDDGIEGEDNAPINIWQGKGFEDDEEEFNSLAISIDEDKNPLLSLKIIPKNMDLVSEGKTIAVKSLIISKSEGGEVVPPVGDEEYYDRCEAGPEEKYTGHIEAKRFDYYWNEDSSSCFWCSGLGAKYDPPGDTWGWIEDPTIDKETCLRYMNGELPDR